MRVGWLHDRPGYVGGAERTQAEFAAAAPDGVEVVDCPPGRVDASCDVFCVHNCVTYALTDLQRIVDRPVFKYWNDVGSWLDEDVRAWLDTHATPICCSPLQAEHMGMPADVLLIPPPVDMARFAAAAASVNGARRGSVAVASWRNLGKGSRRAAEWGAANGGVDFFGDGPFAPDTSRAIRYEGMPGLLASYETFVFIPQVIEPFGRVVAEAWAAGCEIVTNDLVGARYWIETDPDAITQAPDRFWQTVLS